MLQQQADGGGGGSEAWHALVQYNLAVLLAEAGQVDEALNVAGKALEACSSSEQQVSGPLVWSLCSQGPPGAGRYQTDWSRTLVWSHRPGRLGCTIICPSASATSTSV